MVGFGLRLRSSQITTINSNNSSIGNHIQPDQKRPRGGGVGAGVLLPITGGVGDSVGEYTGPVAGDGLTDGDGEGDGEEYSRGGLRGVGLGPGSSADTRVTFNKTTSTIALNNITGLPIMVESPFFGASTTNGCLRENVSGPQEVRNVFQASFILK